MSDLRQRIEAERMEPLADDAAKVFQHFKQEIELIF
jgi:hypothetical protein